MRLLALPIFLLLASPPATAGTVLISSDSQRHGALAALPELVFGELQKAGAKVQNEGRSEADGLRFVQIRKLDCRSRSGASGKEEEASCKFEENEGGGRWRSLRLGSAQALTDALRDLGDATDSLSIVECDSSDDCRIRMSSILCMVNEHLGAGAAGRANCSFAD